MIDQQAPGALPYPSAARGWWAVAVFSIAAILSYTDRQILSLLVDPLKADLHISDSDVGLLQGLAFVLIYALAGLPLGRLADTLPRRSVLLAGVLIWSLGTLACGYATSFGWLFAARVVVGVGEAALAPAAISMIGDLFPPERRGTANGVFLTGMVIGGGAALTIGGAIVQAAGAGLFRAWPLIGALTTWRAVLVLLALPGPLVALLLLSVPEPARRHRTASPKQGRHEATSLSGSLAGFRSRAAVLVPLYGAMALMSVGDAAIGNWAPALLSRVFAMPTARIGLSLGLASVIAGMVGTIAGGALADRRVRRNGPSGRMVVAAATAVLGVIGGLIGFAATGSQAVALFSVWALMSGAAGTIGITAVQEAVSNEMRGLAIAVNSFGNILLGIGFGTSLTALLTDHLFAAPNDVGWSMTLVTVPAGIGGAALFWRARRSLRRGAA
jgi:MFS family permease